MLYKSFRVWSQKKPLSTSFHLFFYFIHYECQYNLSAGKMLTNGYLINTFLCSTVPQTAHLNKLLNIQE